MESTTKVIVPGSCRDLWGSFRVGSQDLDLGSSSFGVYMECPGHQGTYW